MVGTLHVKCQEAVYWMKVGCKNIDESWLERDPDAKTFFLHLLSSNRHYKDSALNSLKSINASNTFTIMAQT